MYGDFQIYFIQSQVMYSRMEEADALIDDLSRDKDPNLRICGMYTIAMAYCGTGNNKAIKQLLHVAVSSCLIKYCTYTFEQGIRRSGKILGRE